MHNFLKRSFFTIVLVLFSSSNALSYNRDFINSYKSLYRSHHFSHKDDKFIGGWDTDMRLKQLFGVFKLKNNDIYIPLLIMQTLDDVNKLRPLPSYNNLFESFESFVDGFLRDVRGSGYPYGSINFWRSYPDPKTGLMRVFPRSPETLTSLEKFFLNLRDVPNDFDDSAQMCEWLIQSHHPEAKDFCLAMVSLLSKPKYQDVSLTRQSSFDDRWKSPGSGAYGTWTESNPAKLPYDGNDVDCVVNMNILASFNSIEKAFGENALSSVESSAAASCKVIQKAVKDDTLSVCSPYYDKTHALWALSKLYKKKHYGKCVDEVKINAQNILYKHIKDTISKLQKRFLKPKIDVADLLETGISIINFNLYKNPRYKRISAIGLKEIYKYLKSKSTQSGLPKGFVFQGVVHFKKKGGKLPAAALWESEKYTSALYMKFISLLHENGIKL